MTVRRQLSEEHGINKDGSLKDSVYGTKDGEYSLAYNDLIAPLIKAVQELKAENNSLKARIETLEG